MTMNMESAFATLRSAVGEYYDAGRRITAAGLKGRLRQTSNQEFDEKQLGFATFRAFLSEAQARGEVALHPGAVDLFVTPPGTSLPEEQQPFNAITTRGSEALAGPPQRIRADLWRSFVDWTPGTQRYFDHKEGHAFSLPSRPSPKEQGTQRARREAIANDPSRFVKIDPIAFDDQLGWMHEFAGRQKSPIKEQLQLALASDRPARDFSAQVRSVPALANAWHRALVDRVGGVIERWSSAHGVRVDISESKPTLADSGSPSRQSALRSVLHRAIDRMPEHELAAISLPVGYIVDQDDRD
jgi:hypothetical protein